MKNNFLHDKFSVQDKETLQKTAKDLSVRMFEQKMSVQKEKKEIEYINFKYDFKDETKTYDMNRIEADLVLMEKAYNNCEKFANNFNLAYCDYVAIVDDELGFFTMDHEQVKKDSIFAKKTFSNFKKQARKYLSTHDEKSENDDECEDNLNLF